MNICKRLLTASLLLLVSVQVNASLLRFDFSGYITQADSLSYTSVNVGDDWSLTLFANDPSGDLRSQNQFGVFQVNWTGMLNVGSAQLSINNVNQSNNTMNVSLGNLSTPALDFIVSFPGYQDIDGTQANGFYVSLFETVTHQYLTDDTIEDSLNYGFDPNSSNVFALSMFGNNIEGKVTSVAVTTVPTPPALLLFGTAILGLVFASRKRKLASA